MLKVLPLLIIPQLFLILFLNVENLTVKLDSKLKIDSLTSSNGNEVLHYKKDEEITILNENFRNKNNEKNLDDSPKNLKPELLKGGESVSRKDLKNTSDIQTINKIPEIKPKPIQITKNNPLKIQFGAFSKLKNAETQKLKILRLFSAKFPEFERKFGILEENNLFKLIYTAENVSRSELICDYSKSIKINCLILKR